ncbi:DCD (Development and Cell Death) domain-like protein isoform 3 [Hibiscus syriacus]|uniref:DCD (Development and Cell Death) domain-like protein isoform 3 n=1 Tax=Hibiscus syriacus TaxID=106335 RepID=A0A6A3BX72_HIBSY|nr:DCD (Development and Cell Death) domain-like protein isoform 3 [Hibiscus syriacus]
MALKSQASHAIVPAQGRATCYNDIIIKAKQIDENDREDLSGFIFMCNGRTKPLCYMYRVFGLPAVKLDVLEKIKPGMKLFLFDFELKLLYGIYEATSVGTLHLERNAFNGRFPAQATLTLQSMALHPWLIGNMLEYKFLNEPSSITFRNIFWQQAIDSPFCLYEMVFKVKFKISMDCLPLHESSFRHAIEYNYQKGSKFKQELNKQQVRCLLSLFQPLTVSAPSSMQPMRLQTVDNQLRLPFPKDSFSHILESQKVQHSWLQQGIGHPVHPNVTHLPLGYLQPNSEPSNIQHSVPFSQKHYFGSTINMGHLHPTTMVTQVSLTNNYEQYMADIQQPYAAGNATQTMPDQYNRYETMGISEQLSKRNMYLLPSQRGGEIVQQPDSVIQYYNSHPSHAALHATTSVLSCPPTTGVPKAANQTLPLAYLHPFSSSHH